MEQQQPGRVGRRLAAIVAADVVGYSRLMGLDEVGTARTLREHRKVTDALVANHGGRLVKTTGDGVLLEFPSVVDAVECAVAVQKVMAERNIGVLGKDAKLAEPRLSPFIQEVEAHADRAGNRVGAVRLVARVERCQALAVEPHVHVGNRPFQRLLLGYTIAQECINELQEQCPLAKAASKFAKLPALGHDLLLWQAAGEKRLSLMLLHRVYGLSDGVVGQDVVEPRRNQPRRVGSAPKEMA